MKQREQALLFLRKAAQDEALLDAVMESVSDEVFGFHCQQAKDFAQAPYFAIERA